MPCIKCYIFTILIGNFTACLSLANILLIEGNFYNKASSVWDRHVRRYQLEILRCRSMPENHPVTRDVYNGASSVWNRDVQRCQLRDFRCRSILATSDVCNWVSSFNNEILSQVVDWYLIGCDPPEDSFFWKYSWTFFRNYWLWGQISCTHGLCSLPTPYFTIMFNSKMLLDKDNRKCHALFSLINGTNWSVCISWLKKVNYKLQYLNS